MDLSPYFDEELDARTKDLPNLPYTISVEANKTISADPFNQGPTELTDEIAETFFHDFEKEKIFIASFNGPGPVYKSGQVLINTWSFTDKEGLVWYIPQWLTMDVPQGLFKGFSKEDPNDHFIYGIEYLELIQTARGKKHHIKIHRKFS